VPVARPRCCAVVTIKAPRSPQIIEGIAHARRHLCQLQIQEVPDLRMPEAMHGSSRFEHRPRPHCPQGSTVWQPLFPFSVWQSMIAADLQLALLWREASMAADQSQACTRTHAQQPHNCRFPSAPSLRKLVGKVQHTSAHRLPGVCAGRRFAQGICSHTVHRTCSSYLGAREAPRGRSRPWGTRAERARCCLRHRARKAFSSARSLITRSARTRSVCVPASQLGRGVDTLIITRDGMV